MRTRWRFGLNRRLVATIDWLLECPNAGAFPQTAHTFDMGWPSIASAYGVADGRRRVRRSAISRAESAASEPLFPCRPRAPVVPGRPPRPPPPVRGGVGGEDAEGDGDACLEPGELEPAGGLAGDV